MSESIKERQPLILKTKTKIGTKVKVATLVLVIGLGVMAAIGNVEFGQQVCVGGPQNGQSCRNNTDCISKADQGGRCIARKILPDLVVQSVSFDPVTRMPTVSVLNQGRTSAQWGTPSRLEVNAQWLPSADNTRLAPGSILGGATAGSSVTTLEPGASTSVAFTTPPYSIPTDTSRAYICVDAGTPGVLEFNERNNCWKGDLPPPISSAAQLYFTLHPGSPSGASVPGLNEVLRFNVSASGGDVFVQNMQIRATGRDGAGRRWTESDSFRRNWRMYDAIDLATPIGTAIEVPSFRWDGPSLWLTEVQQNFGGTGLLIPSGTIKTFILRADTTGASPMADDTVRFDVQVARWQTNSGILHEETGASGAPLVIGNRISY